MLVADNEPEIADDALLTGIGAGSGIVEGPVRIVHDPAVVEVEPGEVLVAPTTDPSWASIMFVSSALVVDIGSVCVRGAGSPVSPYFSSDSGWSRVSFRRRPRH